MTPLWFYDLLFWSAQVALLVLVAGLLLRLLQIRQPRVLLLHWRVLLAINLVLPFVEPWHRVPASAEFQLSAELAAGTPETGAALTHWHFPGVPFIAQIIGLVVLVGIAVRFLILALGLLKLRQFRRGSWPISGFAESAALVRDMGAQMNTRAEFRVSADVDSPVTFGLAKPVILLPERFCTLDSRFQSAIACHELLHVRRRDWAHHLAEEAIRAVFWFHPAFAWLIARVRLAREQIVDLEVVRLTNARKTYLEALLAFADGRASAIPAPPFLAERQLLDRIALMLKEVPMSRNRLIASTTAIACCLAFTITLAARAFPLKGAPRAAQSAPASGVAQGVAGGIAGGVAGGVSGGVKALVSGSVGGDTPNVDRSTIWTDTVKKGSMVWQVRGLGTLVRAEDSANLVARVTLPEFMTADVRPDQNAAVDTRKGLVKGHVSRVSPSPSGGTRTVDIALDAALPEGAGVDLPVSATIDIGKLENVIYVGRPVHGAANSSVSLFKLASDGAEAQRVTVKLGRASVQTIEVLDGLKPGDQIILSDMSQWDQANRIHLR